MKSCARSKATRRRAGRGCRRFQAYERSRVLTVRSAGEVLWHGNPTWHEIGGRATIDTWKVEI